MPRAVAFFALVIVSLAAPAAATLLAQGDPIALDAPHRCNGGDPAVAALAGGAFVVVWTDGATLSSRRLDAAGRVVGTEIILANGQPLAPEVVGLPSGGYAAVWFDPQRAKVFARFADAADTLGPEVEVGSAGPYGDFGGLDATVGPDGTLVVVWTSGEAALLRELRPDGSALATPFEVAFTSGFTGFKFGLFSPVVLAAPDRSIAVFWVEGEYIPTFRRDGDIAGRRLVRHSSASGYQEVRRISSVGFGHDLEGAIAADGSYLLAWAGTLHFLSPPTPPIDAVFALAFGPEDTPREEYPSLLYDNLATSSAELAVAALAGGKYVVAWQTETGAPANTRVTFARELDANGQPRGERAPLGKASSSGQVRPDVAAGADGLLLMTWEELENPLALGPTCAGEHIRVRPYRTACDVGACLGEGRRFELTLDYFDPRRGVAGTGHGVRLTRDTAYFWFFAPGNVEVVAKVIDGRAVNGHFWFFWGGLTDLGLRLTLRDTVSGKVKTYRAEPGTMVSAADVSAVLGGAPVSVQKLRVFELDRQGFPAAPGSRAMAVPASSTPARADGPGGPGPCSPPELSGRARAGPLPHRRALRGGGHLVRSRAKWHRGGRRPRRRQRLPLVLRPRKRRAVRQGPRRACRQRPLLGLLRRAH